MKIDDRCVCLRACVSDLVIVVHDGSDLPLLLLCHYAVQIFHLLEHGALAWLEE